MGPAGPVRTRSLSLHIGACDAARRVGLFLVAISSNGCNSYHTLTVDEMNGVAELLRMSRVDLEDRSKGDTCKSY
jgi:hypothetical protein